MDLIRDLIAVAVNGLKQLSEIQLIIAVISAVVFSIICYLICNYYSRLWNKGFQATISHKLLSATASALTFVFVLAFVGFSYFQEAALSMLNSWANNINNDSGWSQGVFHKAYSNVKSIGMEDFSSNPIPIPCTRDETKKYLANFYTTEVSNNFNSAHRFLSKIIWAKGGIAPEKAEKDMTDFFQKNPHVNYNLQKTVSLVTETIKSDLEAQTPRVVTFAKTVLVIMFILIQAIPFGIIGWAAYTDLRGNVKYSN